MSVVVAGTPPVARAARTSGRRAHARRARGGWAWAAGLLGVDVVLAVGLFGRAWAHPASVTPGGRQDAPYTIWAMAWAARAVSHGHAPWITTSLSWPRGVNLLTNATLIGVGVVLTPLTLVFGPIAAFTVAATAAVAGSAWSAQVVFRRAGLASWPAAGVGGLVAGFGPTSIAQLSGNHLHVSSFYLIPPLLLGIGRLMTGTARYPGRWGAAVGALAAAQLLVGEEVLALVAIAVVVAVVIAGRSVAWRSVGQGAVVGGAVFVALAAWPLVVQFTGRGHISGPIQLGDHYVDDLTAFVVPVRQMWLRTAWTDRIAARASSEQGAYLGVPLVIVAGWAAWAVGRRRPVVRRIALAGAAVAVLSLGSHLVVAGHRTGIPLPWAAVAHQPLLQSVIPARFGVLLDLAAGALLAVGLDRAARLRRARQGAVGFGLAAGMAAVCVVPLVPRLPFRATRWTVPAGFASAGVPSGSLVVVSPYPSEKDPQVEVWLASVGDRWRTYGGTYFVPTRGDRVTIGGPAPASGVVDVALESGRPLSAVAGMAGIVRTSVAQDRVAAIIVAPGPHADRVVAWWTSLFGPPVRVGVCAVWHLSARLPGHAR